MQPHRGDKAAGERERGWNSDLIALLPGTSGKRSAKPIKADFTSTPYKLYVGSNNVAADSHRVTKENGEQQGSNVFLRCVEIKCFYDVWNNIRAERKILSDGI